jgi:hypothetical protein
LNHGDERWDAAARVKWYGFITVLPRRAIRSLARSHARTALNVLVGVMRSKDATAAAKVSAANAILDRGWVNGLQLRLMRALESRARRNGWNAVVSDTTDNLASENNFIRAGYRLYQPQTPWAWPNTLYWRKSIR